MVVQFIGTPPHVQREKTWEVAHVWLIGDALLHHLELGHRQSIVADDHEYVAQGHPHLARRPFTSRALVERDRPVVVPQGFDVLVQLHIDVAPVAINGAQPGGVAEGNGHLLGITKDLEGLLHMPLLFEQTGHSVVRRIQGQRSVRTDGEIAHLREIKEDGIRILLVEFDVQIFCRLQAVLSGAGGVVPSLNQRRHFWLTPSRCREAQAE